MNARQGFMSGSEHGGGLDHCLHVIKVERPRPFWGKGLQPCRSIQSYGSFPKQRFPNIDPKTL